MKGSERLVSKLQVEEAGLPACPHAAVWARSVFHVPVSGDSPSLHSPDILDCGCRQQRCQQEHRKTDVTREECRLLLLRRVDLVRTHVSE
jgi:hypothetical protein